MPESKKIIGTLWQSFKMLALAILILLIIAALYFQAPWKVTALFLIILLANVFLPKGKRGSSQCQTTIKHIYLN